ncbi:AraC family transcriptional regulator [Bacillus sp. AFS076308]|uniref:helix-turn-helix domain-containing protein n=1 Tax=unclassified Bacillus (in: firmicutes) TaxID=185979 RepID=UPI000BF7B41A|nr:MULTISPECIES: helix-turn-helix domain-containing protein [unclassified Bacillus (in: firmicutes)]PFO06588.1 AraC family transcriptional regulator [Bacillus sp. AFS076308]PGV52858.1 AraC family transcriptional regulator [Bacillus sp. AFS037270]
MELDRPSTYDGLAYSMVIAGHFHERDTYSTLRPDGMSDWLITYTLGGEGYFEADGCEQRARAGDVTLLKPGTPHRYGTPKGKSWHFVWAHFNGGFMDASLLPLDALTIRQIEQQAVRERIYQAFLRILSDSRERGAYWHELCLSALREVLMLIAKQQTSGFDPRIEETLYLLAQRMQETIRVEDLARSIGLSASRLSHLFKENTGESIVEVLNRMRIKQAALLLSHTNRNATEAAHDVGFQNYNHFTRQFRKYVGLTPSEFSQSVRSKEKLRPN